mgnify:CR=1 FL=1
MLDSGTEAALSTEIAFWVLTLCTLISAIAVVQIKDLFRAALFLIVALLGVAGLFILLRAEFLAGVQLMIYVGAISVLIIFAILMTRDVEEANSSHAFRLPIAILSIVFMGISIYAITNTNWNLIDVYQLDEKNQQAILTIYTNSIPTLARMLLTDFVLAFEAVSVLLLAAVLGAMALVREER